VLFQQYVLMISVDQQKQDVQKLEKKYVTKEIFFAVWKGLEKENALKEDVVMLKQNAQEKKCKRQFKSCKWFGKERCRTFTYKCELKKYKNNKSKTQCCKKENICIGKKCQNRIVWCKWKGQSQAYKNKKICQMVTIKQHKYLVVKRKRCSLYRKKCVSKKRM